MLIPRGKVNGIQPEHRTILQPKRTSAPFSSSKVIAELDQIELIQEQETKEDGSQITQATRLVIFITILYWRIAKLNP